MPLPKYYRIRLKWDADQTLTYDNGARVSIRVLQWKFNNQGALVYDAVDTDDFGFGAGDTIADEGEEEATVVDNTSNLNLGFQGYLEVTADQNSTDGTMHLYIEESDDNTNWPSDQDDFDIDGDLKHICAMDMSTDAEDESRGKNFWYS